MADNSAGAVTVATGLDGIKMPAAAGVAQLTEAHVRSRTILRAAPEVAARMHAAGSLALPPGINRAGAAPAGASLQLGPDEWLILAIEPELSGSTAAMAAGAHGAPHALVDVSDRSIGLVLEGPLVEDVLAEGCPLPLDVATFPVDRATRTLLGKAEIVLWRLAPDRFHIEVARSFGPYLVAFTAQAIATEAAFAGDRQG